MNRSRTRLQTAVLGFILLPATAGVLAVHASQTCERFVRTYVDKPVRVKFRQTTLDAWAKWREAHPNWKPKPRPHPAMTHDEAVNKVQFACTMPTDPANLDLLFSPADMPPMIVDLAPASGTQIDFPDVVPPEVAELSPNGPPFAPFVPPILGNYPGGVPSLPATPPPPPVGDVSEPPSLLLAGFGAGAVWLTVRMRGRRGMDCGSRLSGAT
jgi:hypothetical protein